MEKNKTGKPAMPAGRYFKYAIGEIILVVIGILIALQVNNWNELNKIDKQQENYLRLVKREMMSNLKSLAIEKEELSQTLNGSRKILNIINADSQLDTISESELSKTIASTLSSDIIIQYENGALNQIVYSGSLKDIENDSIRGILASWEGKINLVRLQEGQLNNAITEVKNLLKKYGEYRNLIEDQGLTAVLELNLSNNRGSNRELMQLKEFENLCFNLSLTGKSLQIIEYPNFEKEMQSLIGLINEELSEK
jgi:hypothetical protein